MRAERLASLPEFGIGWDLETHLIQPGLVAPPIVCGSLAVHRGAGTIDGEIFDVAGVRQRFAAILADARLVITGANLTFDLLCLAADAARCGVDIMPQLFDLYDPTDVMLDGGQPDGRVFDVLIAEALGAIAEGHMLVDPATGQAILSSKGKRTNRYGLDNVTLLVAGRVNAKINDRYRQAYATLEGTPIEGWPYEARTYPIDDAKNPLDVALRQAGHLPAVHVHRWDGDQCTACGEAAGGRRMCWTTRARRNLHDLSRQAYAAFALSLGAAYGFVVDQDEVDRVEAKYLAKHDRDLTPFVDAGILRPADDKKPFSEVTSVLKRRVAWAYGSREACPTCNGTAKVVSPTTGKSMVGCKACSATGLVLVETVPRTDKDGVKTDKDALEESGDDLLVEYEAHCDGAKIPTTYLPWLRHQYKEHAARDDGTCARCPDLSAPRCQPPNWRTLPITLHPNVLLETGRVSYGDPSQTVPRGWGLRECLVARPGTAYSSTDYKAGELVAHAQNCLELVGHSALAQALNAGLDAHLALAGTMIGKPIEWCLEHRKDKQVTAARQAAKPPNFGFPGGMGAQKLVLTQRRQGPDTPHPSGPSWIDGVDGTGAKIKVRGYRGLRFCLLMGHAERCGEVKLTTYRDRPITPTCEACLRCAEDLKRDWLKTWPENGPYFKLANAWSEQGWAEQTWSRRIRGGIDYCSGANGQFQARLAEATKNAACQVQRECLDRTVRVRWGRFAGGGSPLIGSRLIAFWHDEVFCQHPLSVLDEAAGRVGEIMEHALRVVCPDMGSAVEAKPAAMLRWFKGAEEVRDAGRLVPWAPNVAA